MRRKRKKARIRPKPKPIIWLLLVLVVGSGIWWSPITSIRRVRVVGALPHDRERIEGIVAKLEGIPNVQVDPRVSEGDVMNSAEVANAELTRSLFGSALMKVTYRTAVARLLGHPNVLLSSDGALYKASAAPEGLPQVQVPDNGPPTLVTLVANWQPQKMAKLSQDVLKLGFSGVIRIQVEEGGLVCLNMDSGRVVLGTLENLDKKLSVLSQRLSANPQELSQVKELILTAPDSPSIVPKEGRS